jgi:hypothetical protein
MEKPQLCGFSFGLPVEMEFIAAVKQCGASFKVVTESALLL